MLRTHSGKLVTNYLGDVCERPRSTRVEPSRRETDIFCAVRRRRYLRGYSALITSLREQNKGTLLAYSVEVDENQGGRADQWKRNVEEMIASVEFAGDFEDTRKGSRKTWVAIKLSALVPSADSLKRMSKFLLKSRPADDVPFPGTPGSFDMVVFRGAKEPLIKAGLTEEDIESLRVLYEDLRTVCNRAKERGIREFNKPSSSGRFNEQPLVYATYQAYLKRTPLHLARSIEDAQAFGYTLGVKLVRGAYYDKETAEYPESQSPNCPVWAEKSQTDALSGSQNAILTGAGWLGKPTRTSSPQTDIGILFGTHNALSCTYILENLVDAGLAHRSGDKEVVIADGRGTIVLWTTLWWGMRDDLTDWMVHTVKANSPMVLKYVPYGALADASDAVLG
ncbi:Converts proline delta-1-pyrroline-5-carboxylate [Rhizoctonia solani]|uniref:Proline dehydrogenase n=1 Tax=Rhizoctonia solani TaxID=456999 RepID=A0A8H7M8U8_9AGAM|nr:Converts proline delta-1-pyrroline-5-carboxylate [Rhizoctonia solani]